MKRFFMLVLLPTLLTLTIAQQAHSANTENYRSPMGTNLGTFDYWADGWVFADAFVKSSPWVSSLCSGGWDNGPAITTDSNGWVSSLDVDLMYFNTCLYGHERILSGRGICHLVGRRWSLCA
ncbi:MAG: hypothetical protein SFH39_09280 [Candidatus Magnetobacterium sp. LHC-1]|uniref:Secreted protein n=1 Tax=Candidatus Magnetobacterium casense TaxID=1455061 RepID=A0ABS6S073_9BACT|nr:hypothetical protein [Candidatus Magnetobacterium casensis]MBV6342252.1 hypothetical protein [Candidatus Magnetobacterium casensis]